jgi:hypothetical protein
MENMLTNEIIKRWTPFVQSKRVHAVMHTIGTAPCSRNELSDWLYGKAEIDSPLYGIEFENVIKIK